MLYKLFCLIDYIYMIVQGESSVSSLLEYTAEPQPILCKDKQYWMKFQRCNVLI